METTLAIPPADAPHESLVVKVVSEGDVGGELVVDRQVLIGTSEVCDLKLSDRTVSRRHISVTPSELGVRVIDLESRNGTWLASARVSNVEIPPGSELRIGNTSLRVERQPRGVEPVTEGGEATEESGGYGRFLGKARCLAPLYKRLHKVASSDATVLIEGESGTGKELLAEAIHDQSPRAGGPFVVVDCGALAATLLESELFGHERGAFTGADSVRIGAFEGAHSGTIFLDEIGELSLPLQTRLLGALDRRQIRRLGGQRMIELDVRVVAATNRNLDREVEESRFRLDLFHRLAVALIRVPPLRERTGDVELLARHFLGQLRHAGEELLSPEILGRLRSHPWPGNVRELRNHVEGLALFGEDMEELRRGQASSSRTASDIVRSAIADGLSYQQVRARMLEMFTDTYVEVMLESHGGNISRAAEAAGVARRHFHRLKTKK